MFDEWLIIKYRTHVGPSNGRLNLILLRSLTALATLCLALPVNVRHWSNQRQLQEKSEHDDYELVADGKD